MNNETLVDKNQTLERLYAYLRADKTSKATVKLDFKSAPFAQTGIITDVNFNTFVILVDNIPFERSLTDLLYYRLA